METPKTTRYARWACICDCGKTASVLSGNLAKGSTLSCGCYKQDLILASIKKVTLICKQCGGEYVVKRKRSQSSNFCSKSCQGNWQKENVSGENSWNWKEDITDKQRIIGRNYPEYRSWIQSVYERDNYTCQVCGQVGYKLRAHHLYSYSDYPSCQIKLWNGITLCRKRHKDFHLWMGHNRVPCTKLDFYTWIHFLERTNKKARRE